MAGEFALSVGSWADKAGGEIDATLRAIVLEILRRLILKSPVKTGRFRGNWQVGIGHPESGVIGEEIEHANRRGGLRLGVERGRHSANRPGPERGKGKQPERLSVGSAPSGEIRSAEDVLSVEGGKIQDWSPTHGQAVLWISNNLPYAVRLEYGWSKQAPSGMVRVTLLELGAIVQALPVT